MNRVGIEHTVEKFIQLAKALKEKHPERLGWQKEARAYLAYVEYATEHAEVIALVLDEYRVIVTKKKEEAG